MARITKVLGLVNKGNYGVVMVRLEDGTEAEVYIGGSVEVFFDERYGKIKAFIKKAGDKSD